MMADIRQRFSVGAGAAQVFEAVATPAGLDNWWTSSSSGKPSPGAEYELGFGPGCDWRAEVSRCMPNTEFELTLTRADGDWLGTRVGFLLAESEGATEVEFYHLGWPEANDHYRTSCYCWAMYLRIMKRYVEFGEQVPYEDRLDV